jgi:hypothetical protein
MNALDVMKYGHQTVLTAVDGLAEADAIKPGVCSVWSAKDIIAHLASFELLLEDALKSFTGGGPTPIMDAKAKKGSEFNDSEVAERRGMTYGDVLAEYETAHERVMTLINTIPAETLRKEGTIPWYGPEYSLDDFIVYANYAHKREHCGQIRVFRRRRERNRTNVRGAAVQTAGE